MIERIREEIGDASYGITGPFVLFATAITVGIIIIAFGFIMAIIQETLVLTVIGGIAFIALCWYLIVKWAQHGA